MKKTSGKKLAKIAGSVLLVIFAAVFVIVSAAADVFHVHEALAIDQKLAVNMPQQTEFTKEYIRNSGEHVFLNPYGISPLTAVIYFTTENEVAPKVEVEGKDENTNVEFEFNAAREHFLPIYGLYANKENIVKVSYGDKTDEYKIKTEALPEDMVLPEYVKAEREKLGQDWYFVSPAARGYTTAYDVNGDVRWFFSQTASWNIGRLNNGHLLVGTDRIVGKPYYNSGLYEMDLLGKIYTEYKLPGGYHHDNDELPNGNLLVGTEDLTDNSSTVEDMVVELDRKTGEVVKTFDLKKVLPQVNTGNEDWSSEDWFHNNAIWYDDDTKSITLSGRHMDAVINISYETGELNWIIGDKTGWPEEYQKYFFKPVGDGEFGWQWFQHAAMITPEGYVFVFDNGNNKSKIEDERVAAKDSYSRGVMYKVDTEKMEIEQVWQYGKERGSDFYSPYISDVDYIAKNHYLIHSGGISFKDGEVQNKPATIAKSDKLLSDTVELIDDEVVFEIKLPTNNYRAEKMFAYTDADKSGMNDDKMQRLGSLGETSVEEKKSGFYLKDFSDMSEIADHNVEITNQGDRLVVSGQFKEGTNVRLVLVKGFEQRYYKIRINNQVHAAMCIAVFNEDENSDSEEINVARYVNAEGLSGTYKLYLEVYDKTYDTGKSVKF